MKLTIILLAAAIVQVSAKGLSQTVSFNGKNAPLQEVFSAIKKQTGFTVIYNAGLLNKAKTISLNVTEVPLEDFLRQLFKDQPLDYSIENTTIFVSEKKTVSPAVDLKAASDLLFSPIRGRVLDADGAPLAGATVTLRGGKVVGVTDAEGIFSVNVSVGDMLVISSVGFESTEYKITSAVVASSNQQSTQGTVVSLTISLKRKENKLEEVVVNKGYYQTSKKLNTGNVSKVSSQEIEKQPVSNPLSALQGRVPGLEINQQTGVAGGAFTVLIRGRNSIARGNNPLFIIDGIPVSSNNSPGSSFSNQITALGNSLSSINPEDIESIEILKDADATAIYGSRGANGVILITTKKGKPGETAVNFNIYAGAGKVNRMLDLLNTPQYLAMRREAFNNDGVTPTTGNARDLLVWDTSRYTDWQKMLIGKTAHVTDAQVSVSGGNKNTQFLIGGGFHRETTVFPGDFSYQKISGHFNIIHTSKNDKFSIMFSSSYFDENNKLPYKDPVGVAITLAPVAPPIYGANGGFNWGPAGATFTNPIATLLQTYQINTGNLISSANLNYRILPGLNVKANLGYTVVQTKDMQKTPSKSIRPALQAFVPASTSLGNRSIKTWIVEPQLQYDRNISNGALTVLVGGTFQQNLSDGQELFATGFSSDALLENPLAASSVTVSSSAYNQYHYQAIFGRINYNWKEKYLINLTARRDGSSRFGPGRQYANFGAIGAAWIFSNEKFIENGLPFLSYGKFRASYGTTGNDQIGDYEFLDTWTPNGVYQENTGLFPTRLFNPDFAWETNKKMEAAIELGALNNRLLFTASFYRNRSSNQLVGYPLPPTTGFQVIQSNFPAVVQNKGVELELSNTNIKTKNFTWTSSVNVTFPQNKLIRYANIENSSYANIYEVGKSLFVQKRFHFTGVDPMTGLYKFEDVNGNGIQADYPEDLQGLKELKQKYYGGFQNSFSYKGLQLDLFFQFVKQTGVNYLYGLLPGYLGNQPITVLNRWQKTGDNTNIQRFSQAFDEVYNEYNNALSSDQTLSDASFIRLKNLSLSYQLPARLSQKARIKNSKIYIQAQNLLTITSYSGMDPETQSASSLPPLRMITAGVQITL